MKAISRHRLIAGFGVSAVLAATVLAGCSSGGTDDSGAAGEAKKLVIGAVLPETGAQASLGQAQRAGLELGAQCINESGGVTVDGENYEIELDVKDDQSTPEGAQRAVQALLNDGTKFWAGPAISSSFATAYGRIQGTDTQLVFTGSAESEKYLEEGSDLLFKTQGSQAGGGIQKYVEFLVETYDPQTVAVLEPQNPTGELILETIVPAFEENGVEVVYKNYYDLKTTDFTPFISAIRTAAPDMVIGPYIDPQYAQFIGQALQVQYKDPVWVSYGGSYDAVSAVKDQIEDFSWQIVMRGTENADDPIVEDFRTRFQDEYGKEPTALHLYSLSYFDPIQIVAKAIEKAGTVDDPTAVGKQIRSVTDWPCKVLDMKFDEKGLAHYEFQVGTVKNGTVAYQDLGVL